MFEILITVNLNYLVTFDSPSLAKKISCTGKNDLPRKMIILCAKKYINKKSNTSMKKRKNERMREGNIENMKEWKYESMKYEWMKKMKE